MMGSKGIYLFSDSHFGHSLPVRLGERNEGFEKEIIEAWNSTVRPIDTVLHLGDFSLGRYKNYSLNESVMMWRNQLSGTIVLVRGNHDRNHSCNWWMNHGFTFCVDELSIHQNKMQLLFTHEPVIMDNFDINIHGHMHGNGHRAIGELKGYSKVWNGRKYFDVSNHKQHGYKPINLNDLLDLI